ncbi:MAG TPA: electron transfer flavoprotein subunit beta/FixA family protein [Polyangiaceae bacterium]|nr:electron transfer flavoprotein subunit beta/FixA family protein [Polyangiaceae bacterium]
MKILCTAKRVPDPEIKLRVAGDGSGYVKDGVKWVVNPFDEIAVEESLRLKEKHGGEVVVVSIGPADAAQQVRQCLAMGADRGVLVKADGEVDSDAAARAIVKIIQEEKPDLVIMGKQAVDYDSSQAAAIAAELLGWGQAAYASKVVVADDGKSVRVTREVDGGLETVDVVLPGIVTADLRLNEPRYASLPSIMKAKKKPLKETTFAELGVDAAPKVKSLKIAEPPARKAGQLVPDVPTLVKKLHDEAKVI